MTLPTLFIPHGGGPCFFMDPAGGPPDPMWRPMQAYLAGVIASLPERPRAILMISGHWEEPELTINGGDGHPMLFDYYGFPEHTYRLDWPSHGSPAVARRAVALLEDAGFSTQEDSTRGWDHGVFIPMMWWCRMRISRWCSFRCAPIWTLPRILRSAVRWHRCVTKAC